MSTVQYLNHVVDRQLVQKMFVKFANKYGNLWTSRLGEHGDWKGCEDDWLEELSAFSLRDAINGIKKALVIYRNYPPTQGQVIELCMAESGVPSVTDVIRLMVNRDFTHPIVKMVYDKIGSWTLTNGKEQEIQSKAKSAYDLCIADFQCNPKGSWELLASFNERPLLEAPPTKVATPAERRGFKERMEEFQRLADEGKAKLKDMQVIEFDPKKIRGDGEQREDYEKYLLSIPEHMVLGLPSQYAYDRQRLLNMKDTARHLKECGYIPPNEREVIEQPRSGNNKPTKMYKNWNSD